MSSGEPLATNPANITEGPNRRTLDVPGSSQGPVPIVRLYGVTGLGNSVCLHVHGFTPYFYALMPKSYTPGPAAMAQLRVHMNDRLKERARGAEEKKLQQFVLGIDIVNNKRSIYGYKVETESQTFIKIYLAMPSLVPGAKRLCDDGLPLVGYGTSRCETYESNVPYVLRFMIDNNIQGADWIELPPSTYSVRSEEKKVSRCQLEVDIVYNQLVSHAPEGEWAKIAPFRILSTDIECMVSDRARGREGSGNSLWKEIRW